MARRGQARRDREGHRYRGFRSAGSGGHDGREGGRRGGRFGLGGLRRRSRRLRGARYVGDRSGETVHVRLLRRSGLRRRAHLRWNGALVRGAARLVSVEIYRELRHSLLSGEPVCLVTVTNVADEGEGSAPLGAKLLIRLEGPMLGGLGDPELDRVVARDARSMLERGVTGTRHYGTRGEARREDLEMFVESFVSPSRLVIFGAVDFSGALVGVGKILGFVVTVCAARAARHDEA